MNTDIVVY